MTLTMTTVHVLRETLCSSLHVDGPWPLKLRSSGCSRMFCSIASVHIHCTVARWSVFFTVSGLKLWCKKKLKDFKCVDVSNSTDCAPSINWLIVWNTIPMGVSVLSAQNDRVGPTTFHSPDKKKHCSFSGTEAIKCRSQRAAPWLTATWF